MHAMNPTMPVFVFFRQRDIEIETGLTLAGKLIVDLPRSKQLHQRFLAHLIEFLAEKVTPDDTVIYGWPSDRPDDADETLANDVLMTKWLSDCTLVPVRITG